MPQRPHSDQTMAEKMNVGNKLQEETLEYADQKLAKL